MSEKERPLSRASLETTTSERLAEIVEAAEQAATKVIDDAEEQARRYLSDARAEADGAIAERLSSLAAATDSLIAQAEEIRRRSDRLLEALEEVRARLEERLGGGDRAGRPTEEGSQQTGRVSHLSAVAPVLEPAEASPSNADPVRASPAGARLLATQMAVSGSSREEIASRLRNGFEIEDTDAILDAILGAEE